MFMLPLQPQGRQAIILANELGFYDAFVEAIDVILVIWEGEALNDIDLPGNRLKVTPRRTPRHCPPR
jgi:hypothetical protein